MDVSIVIVNWNTRQTTAECLESVYANLGGLAAEVWVVDNGSEDGSADHFAAAFPQVRLIRNTDNRGFATANNRAIRDAAGRYILLLNSDTLVLGDVLSKSVAYMDENPDVGVMGCRVLNPDRTMQPTCFGEPSLLNTLLKVTGLFRLSWPRFFDREHMRWWARDDERDVDVVTGCYMLVRREALDAVGLLDESFFFCGEETDWCRRFRQAGWRLRFAPVGEIIHYGNASGRRYEYRRDLLLTAGLLRFHRKHDGPVTMWVVAALLWVFALTRTVYWGVVHFVGRSSKARARRDHFWNLVRRFAQTIPRPNREHAPSKCHANAGVDD